ncbi:MAG: type IV secretory system conjugative DNA transfer family protein [Candidatus Gracilibacteria bacterium]
MEFLSNISGNIWTAFRETALPWLMAHPWAFLVGLVAMYVGFKVALKALRIGYDLYRRHDNVFIRITMPREESQKDKEKAQDKDFREKIAIMEQLYRALSELRELNLMNRLKVWLFQCNNISFEIGAQFKQIQFYIVTYKEYAGLVDKQITAFYPDADLQFSNEPPVVHAKGNHCRAYYLYEKELSWYPIKTYKEMENDPLNDLTNVLSKLEKDEYATVQFVARPISNHWHKKAEEFGTFLFKGKKKGGFLSKIPVLKHLNTVFVSLIFGYENAKGGSNAPGASGGDSYVRMLQTKEEIAKQVGEKANQEGFETVVRVLASSPKRSRLNEMLNNLLLAFTVFRGPGMNYFQNRRVIPLIDFFNTPIMRFNFNHRFSGYGEKESLLGSKELATLFHLPNSRYNYTPVINWLNYKVLPAPMDLPAEGLVLGNNVYRGEKRMVRFSKKDRSRHHYIIGQTGTGKSVYISSLARQDVKNGDGLCVIDPHGDLIEDILLYIPKERAKDVILFNPSDSERPMGLNILEADTPEQQDMASSQATEIFIKIFGDEIFGPRIQHYFRNACLTLMEDKEEGATLIDVPRIFTDDEFMKYKVTKITNPVVRSFWEHEYANTGDRERQEMIPYFSAKFGPFITNSIMRNTIGQSRSAFNFRKVMDERKILLVNLSKGKIGELNTQLLGLVMVAQIQMAAMSRADIPESERKDFYLYVDEFQNFATDTFCSILSEARKYKLSLIMAHQYINQLVTSKAGAGQSTQIRDAVFGNVGTLQSFKVGAEDAEYLAKEYAPVLTEQDIIGIPNYKSYMKLNVNMATSRPFSLDTIYTEEGKSEKIREIVRQYSRMKYGRKKVFVDQEIQARIGIDMTAPRKEINLFGAPPAAGGGAAGTAATGGISGADIANAIGGESNAVPAVAPESKEPALAGASVLPAKPA